MTEPLQHKIGGGRVSPQAAGTPAASRRGWLRFAGLVATLIGASHVIAGLLAWFGSELYVLWAFRPALTSQAVGAFRAGLIRRRQRADEPGFPAAQPVWAALVIGLDVVVLHAVIVRGQRHSTPATDSQR